MVRGAYSVISFRRIYFPIKTTITQSRSTHHVWTTTMPTSVIMPKYEMSQETGKIARWLKAEGDVVEKGEPLLEIETDKTNIEVEARAAGVLAGICAEPGQVVPVGQPIAYILKPGEVWPPAAAAPAPAAAPAAAVTPQETSSGAAGHADCRAHGGRARRRSPGCRRDGPRRPDHARRCRGASGRAGRQSGAASCGGWQGEGRAGRAPAGARAGR